MRQALKAEEIEKKARLNEIKDLKEQQRQAIDQLEETREQVNRVTKAKNVLSHRFRSKDGSVATKEGGVTKNCEDTDGLFTHTDGNNYATRHDINGLNMLSENRLRKNASDLLTSEGNLILTSTAALRQLHSLQERGTSREYLNNVANTQDVESVTSHIPNVLASSYLLNKNSNNERLTHN